MNGRAMTAPLSTEQLACGPLIMSAWLDDPPRLALERDYLEAVRALPLREIAVMVDGPKPGLGDAKWTARDLEALRRALPAHELVLTCWATPQRAAIEELRARLPALLDALDATTVELDVEPIGEWALKGVEGFVDAGGDRGALDEAAERLAEVLAALDVDVELTTFPGAAPNARSLLRALSRQMAVERMVRLVLQVYAVRSRSSGPVAWDGALGPLRHAPEAITRARRDHPGVELVAALAAYDQRWPGREPGDALLAAAASAASVGVQRVRWWSLKHVVRLAGRAWAAPAIESLRSVSL